MNNVLYFSELPSNIISSTALSESLKDDEATWVITKREYFVFTWDFGGNKKKISHSENCLPESEIQSAVLKFGGVSKRVGSISIDSTFNFDFDSITTKEYPITGKPVDFTPGV